MENLMEAPYPRFGKLTPGARLRTNPYGAADGTLTGFGAGLPLKQALLELEGTIQPPEPTLF